MWVLGGEDVKVRLQIGMLGFCVKITTVRGEKDKKVNRL